MFSIRDFLKAYPQAVPILENLDSSSLGRIFPDIVEEHGQNRKLDVVLSPSHSLFIDGIPDAKPSGVYIDKNGNWKAQVNVPIQMNIERLGFKGHWEPIRFFYITGLVKGKLSTSTTDDVGKVFNLQPKTITIS